MEFVKSYKIDKWRLVYKTCRLARRLYAVYEEIDRCVEEEERKRLSKEAHCWKATKDTGKIT